MITMITTCPACHTVFRVTGQQLAAREGMVRCGRCTTIFDARETLATQEPEPPSGRGDRPEDRPVPIGAPAFAEPARISGSPPGAPDTESAVPKPFYASLAPAHLIGQPGADAADEADSVFAAGDADPVFAEDQPQRAPRRALWATASALLALALMTQAAFYYRGEIAVLFPGVRPVLAKLCARLGCDVPLPRRAQLISIEASDLQADPANPGVMVLTATLRNRAAFTQSFPSLELTLTDTLDQPLARRVLAARDYLDRRTRVEAGLPGNSELPVKVYMQASSLKATGYRLYLFFP